MDTHNEHKNHEIAQMLFGTYAGPDFAPGVTFKPTDVPKPKTVMWARCTHCSDEKRRFIRNRTLKGLYLITRPEAIEFAELGGIKLPHDVVLRKHIIQANYCDYCEDREDPEVIIIKRSDFDR